MGAFDLKGTTGGGRGWNYSYPNRDDYTDNITGTVVEISNPLHRNFSTKEVEYFDPGKTAPKRDWCMTLLKQDGAEVDWMLYGGKSGAAAKACLKALDPQDNRDNVSIEELLGKMVTVSTIAPPAGFSYGQSNPRPWQVIILGEGNQQAVRGVRDLAETDNNGHPVSAQPAVQAPAPAPSPQLAYMQQQAAQALGFQSPADAVYDHDIPF